MICGGTEDFGEQGYVYAPAVARSGFWSFALYLCLTLVKEVACMHLELLLRMFFQRCSKYLWCIKNSKQSFCGEYQDFFRCAALAPCHMLRRFCPVIISTYNFPVAFFFS